MTKSIERAWIPRGRLPRLENGLTRRGFSFVGGGGSP